MKKYEITNSKGEIINFESSTPGKFQDAPGNRIVDFALQFISRHVDRRRNIENQAREEDLTNFVRARLEVQNAMYKSKEELDKAEIGRLHNESLSNISRKTNMDKTQLLIWLSRDFESSRLNIEAQNLPEKRKAILRHIWEKDYQEAIVKIMTIYR